MASSPITSWQIDEETTETVIGFISWAPKSLQIVRAAIKLKDLVPYKKSYDQPKQHIKKQKHYFAYEGPSKSLQMVTAAMKLKDAYSLEEKL